MLHGSTAGSLHGHGWGVDLQTDFSLRSRIAFSLDRSSLIHTDAALFHAAVPRARSHLLSAGPRATLARQTSAAARAIGMLTSRAKVACCCLLMANWLTAAELLCAESRTQA